MPPETTATHVPPVLLLIFNRPDTVRKVLDALAVVKPSVLYITADGPRAQVTSDVEKCSAARAAAQAISWPCTVKTLFSEVNLGVDPAVEAGISWFFEHESEGIILEDDCLPHPDFFGFAGEMLERYRNDEHVMMVSGNNFQKGRVRGDGSYYFSRYANTWGWATWKRAWNHYDTTLSGFTEFKEQNRIATLLPKPKEQHYWLKYFGNLHAKVRSAWDAKWIFTMWMHDGIGIVPNVNLVENIGFGADATHTAGDTAMSVQSQTFPPPYQAPSSMEVDSAADRYLFDTVFRITLRDKVRYILTILHERTRSLRSSKSLAGPQTAAH